MKGFMPVKKTTNSTIQQINRKNIFRILYEGDGMTKQDVMATLHLSLPTTTQNIQNLMAKGLITESGSVGNTGGRRAKTYDIMPDAKMAIGLDITRNHVTTVVVDLKGEICYCTRVRKSFSREDDYFRFLSSRVEAAMEEAAIEPERLLGVGIGVPGLVTKDKKTVFYGKILDFTGATSEEFSRYIPYPSILLNDANAGGLAEIWKKKNLGNAFYIGLSNNVGGAVIIDNEVYNGNLFHSGEVGHIRIHPHKKSCYCGQKGCVDAYCAATVLSSLTDGNLAEFFRLLQEGHREAGRLWDTYLDDLALAIINIYMILNCNIIVGGYVGAYLDDYIDDLRQRVKKLNPFEDNADFVVVCSYKNESIAAGAALDFIHGFIESI